MTFKDATNFLEGLEPIALTPLRDALQDCETTLDCRMLSPEDRDGPLVESEEPFTEWVEDVILPAHVTAERFCKRNDGLRFP